jgi:hypothetical protein
MYRTITVPGVLYGCETWSLVLREEHRLRLSENKMARRIFGPKKGETGGGRIMRSLIFVRFSEHY